MKNLRRSAPLFILFWILIAALSIDTLKTGFVEFGKGFFYWGITLIGVALMGIGIGIWRVLRYTYQWDLEKGRVKRSIKLLR